MTHSKTSVIWSSEDVFLSTLFQIILGFSMFFEILTSMVYISRLVKG